MDDTSSKGSAQGRESVADEQGVQVHLSRAKETAAEIVDKLNKEINPGLVDPKLKTRLCRPWSCSVSRFVLRLRQVHGHRNREVGQGDQVLRGEGGLMRRNVP
jgi:hypothetical protein